MGKAFEKQVKTIEDQGQKQIEALRTFKSDNEKLTIKDFIPKNALYNDEARKELDKIKKIEQSVDREKLAYRTNEYTYSFENFQAIKTFGKDIYNGTITLKEANGYQTDLLVEIMNFKKNTKSKSIEKKTRERHCF